MATPNLALGTNTLTPGRALGAVAATATEFAACAASSNKVVNVGGLIITNNDAANDCWITLQIDSGSPDVFVYQLNIPAGATLDVFEEYKQMPPLLEGDALEGIAQQAGDLTYYCWWMEVATV